MSTMCSKHVESYK